MKLNSPLVSVIIPVFNRSEIIKRSIGSVQRQTYQNIELIIVDDGSTEDIVLTARKCLLNSPFQFQIIQQTNSGPGEARKNGLAHAKGEYFVYLDSDDELYPEMIEILSSELCKKDKAVMACCNFEFQNGKEIDLSKWKRMDLLELSLNVRPWPTSACLWRYPDPSRIIWPPLFGAEDIVHDVSAAIQGLCWIHVPRVMVTIHNCQDQLSVLNSSPQNLQRKRKDMVQSRELILNMLLENKLENNRKYAMPFSERCLRGSVELASIGDKEGALAVLELTRRLNITFIQKIQIEFLYRMLKSSHCFPKVVYYGFFRLHRKITPSSLHGNKSIFRT